MPPTSPDRPIAAPLPPPGGCSVRWLCLDHPANRGGPIAAVVVEFDPGNFSADLFRTHGIACPAVIANSGRKRQGEFFFGRWAARLALEKMGRPAGEIPIGPHREPVWPAGLTGSISHTDRLAVACARSADACQGVGIDVERIPPLAVLEEIERLTLNAAEKSLLNRLAAAHAGVAPGLFPTLLFSVKETLFKAFSASPGPPLEFKDAVLSRIDWPAREIELLVTRVQGVDGLPGKSVVAAFELLADGVVLTCFSWN